MKHVVMFSGGAASAYTAKLVIDEFGRDDTVLLHTPTYSEHEDADRFRSQIANYLRMGITERADGRDIWKLIDDEKCLPSYFIPFCTRILKIEQTDRYIKELEGAGEDCILYYGYGIEEYGRIQKQIARFETRNIETGYPIYQSGLTNAEVKRIISNEWGICLPEPYKHLQHNNCIPCWKAGKDHFKAVAKYYPEQFLKAIKKEEMIGHTVFKDCTLQDLLKEVKEGKFQEEMDLDRYSVPCMCSF